MSFKSLNLASYLLEAIENLEFKKPTQIQEKAIPAILKRKDVLGIAPTGSGKTGAYALPLIQILKGKTKTKNRHINALVLVPTRELAVQVEQSFSDFAEEVPFHFKSMAVFGGVSINPQMKGLQNVNVLVATPGRLLELVESNAVHFESLSLLILDEADKMLNLGFKKEMDRIFELLPPKRQNLLFSATLSPEVQKIENVLLDEPVVIKTEEEKSINELINHQGYFIKAEKKGPLLRHLIKTHEWKQVLVFTSSVYQADLVADKLRKNGIQALATHGKKSQSKRREHLANFISGDLRVLVSTDLLSRGIDINFLPYVVNYELPRSPKDFVHRVGRTGRAENPGDAITFVTDEDKHHWKIIQKKMKYWVTMVDGESLDI